MVGNAIEGDTLMDDRRRLYRWLPALELPVLPKGLQRCRQTQTSGFTQQSIALGSGDRKSKDLQTFDLGLDEHPMEMRVTIGHSIDMTLNMPLESFLSDTRRL